MKKLKIDICGSSIILKYILIGEIEEPLLDKLNGLGFDSHRQARDVIRHFGYAEEGEEKIKNYPRMVVETY